MVNAVYDHIIAILVICVMFVGAVVVLPTLSAANIKAVDQQQLRNIALNVFNTMLLDTGKPVNWGSIDPFNIGVITKFGLASAQDSTFYVLDPDKVQRLVKGNPIGELPYNRVKELLGLQGYSFSFQIVPPFNVTNIDGTKISVRSPINGALLSQKKLQYAIKVSDLYGRPIPNATISGRAVYTDKNEFFMTSLNVVTTNSLGIGIDTVNLAVVPWHIMVILRVSVADVATIVVTFGTNLVKVIDINVVGDTIILTRPKDAPNAAVEVKNVYVYGSQGDFYFLYRGQGPQAGDKFNTGSGQHRLWNRTFNGLQNYDPMVFVFHIETVPEGSSGGWQDVVVAGPYQVFLGYTVFSYGDPLPQGVGAIRLQRSVVIAGLTYIAELWLWKESP